MNKFEPLKNKKRFVLNYEVFDDAKKVPESCRQVVFENHDLFSAIEWLKKRTIKLKKVILEEIDETFEDVVKVKK